MNSRRRQGIERGAGGTPLRGAADTGPAPRGATAAEPDFAGGPAPAASGKGLYCSMVSAELASAAIRVQDATSGGAHGTHQV